MRAIVSEGGGSPCIVRRPALAKVLNLRELSRLQGGTRFSSGTARAAERNHLLHVPDHWDKRPTGLSISRVCSLGCYGLLEGSHKVSHAGGWTPMQSPKNGCIPSGFPLPQPKRVLTNTNQTNKQTKKRRKERKKETIKENNQRKQSKKEINKQRKQRKEGRKKERKKERNTPTRTHSGLGPWQVAEHVAASVCSLVSLHLAFFTTRPRGDGEPEARVEGDVFDFQACEPLHG